MVVGERRAAGRDRSDASGIECDHVRVALAHQRAPLAQERRPRSIEVVEDLTLVVVGRVLRVPILRDAISGRRHDPTAERDDLTRDLADREHDASAHRVMQRPVLAAHADPDLERDRRRCSEFGEARRSRRRCIADAELRDLVLADPSSREILSSALTCRSSELVRVPGGLGFEHGKCLATRGRSRLTGSLVLDAKTGSSGKLLDGFSEVEALHLTDEGDRITSGVTAETVVHPELWVHTERRRALVVERTQTDPTPPDPAQRDRLGDERDEVRRIAYAPHIGVGYGHSLKATPSRRRPSRASTTVRRRGARSAPGTVTRSRNRDRPRRTARWRPDRHHVPRTHRP